VAERAAETGLPFIVEDSEARGWEGMKVAADGGLSRINSFWY
jgi:hypothetical protein